MPYGLWHPPFGLVDVEVFSASNSPQRTPIPISPRPQANDGTYLA